MMSDTSDLIHANAGRLLGEMLGNPPAGCEAEGDFIGPYRLCERLGEGGFGIVWRAEQIEPVRREVAVKVIKLGMDTVQVLGRFQQERQALASLDHPCIATMLDAGVSPDGRPYFAMELIAGEPITRWCEARLLPVRERLRIFHQVCHAVHHAHQKGIIHRDLKPNNILVTSIGSQPAPKVIDFGIAKAVHADTFARATLLTQADQMLGTPDYMSPEQFDGGADIDIRSDIYSLGVVLYELLTGVLPFGSTPGTDTERFARTAAPQRPSTRRRKLNRLDRNKPAFNSTSDETFPSGSSDLDWITIRALDKDCNRRYQSAAEFAADIQRFLDNEPVLACPPSFGYISSRWIKRHRTAFVAVCLVVLAMIGGTAVALWQAKVARLAQRFSETEAARARQAEQEAEQAKHQAEKAQQQSQQIAGFLTRLLDRVGQEVRNGRHPEALKAALAGSEQDILTLTTDQELRIELLDRLSGIYMMIGENKLAIPLQREKAAEIGLLHGPESEEAHLAELAYIESVVSFGARATGPGLLEDLRRRIEATGRRGGSVWLDVQRNLCRAWTKLDFPEQALAASEELLAEAKRQKLSRPSMFLNQITRVTALEYAGRYADALALLEKCRESASPKQLVEIEKRLIYVLQRKGDFKRGAELLRVELANRRASSGERSPKLNPVLKLLAGFESDAGDHAAAIAHCELALAIAREQGSKDGSATQTERRDVWQALLTLADCESSAGRYSDGISHAREAIDLATQMDNSEMVTRARRQLADVHYAAGDLEQSYEVRKQCYESSETKGANLRDGEQDMCEMCNIRLAQGRPEEAMKLGAALWVKTRSRPESKDDPAHLAGVAQTVLKCHLALKAAKPETPEPKELAVWQLAVEAAKRLNLPSN